MADNQQIEKKLLQLMEDFETGKLKAFGKKIFIMLILLFHHKGGG